MMLIVFAVVSHLSNPRFWAIHQLKTNIFFHLIKVVGRPFGINLIGFDWNLADSEISWPQLYIQVELSSKTAVSQLLASPSVSYFWSTCHPQHLFFFPGWTVWKWGKRNNRARVKNAASEAIQGTSCCLEERRAVHWLATVICKDTGVQGQIQPKVNDKLCVLSYFFFFF